MDGPVYTIRAYRAEDRRALRCISADTAFFGAPAENLWDDRELFNDVRTAAYTDYEPESIFVAEFRCPQDVVGGYLTGCLDTRQHTSHFLGRMLPYILTRMVRGRYRIGSKTWRLWRRALHAFVAGEFARVDLRTYPAHLHVNVAAPYRGQGAGRALLARYLAYLQNMGVSGVHLHTSTQNRVACHLYESLGFGLLARHETKMYVGLVEGPVEFLVYGKSLLS